MMQLPLGSLSLLIVILAWPSYSQTRVSPEFSKSFPNGSSIEVTRQVIIERRSRLKHENPAIGEDKLFENKEVKVVTYSVWCRTPGSDKRSIIWSNTYNWDADDERSYGSEGRWFYIIDALLNSDNTRAYVIYRTREVVVVRNFELDESGVWVETSETEISDKNPFTPAVNIRFLSTKRPEIYLEIVGSEKLYPRRWVLSGDKWKRK